MPRNEREGTTPGGQAPEGRTNNSPREPRATERTQAEERRARAATEPAKAKREEVAEKTNKEGELEKAERTALSTPAAQPTETRQPKAGIKGKTECNSERAAAEGEREPEKPTDRTATSNVEIVVEEIDTEREEEIMKRITNSIYLF